MISTGRQMVVPGLVLMGAACLVMGGCGGAASIKYGRSVAVLSDGSALVTGYFLSTATFGAGEANETIRVGI